jgi:hypothetical protein
MEYRQKRWELVKAWAIVLLGLYSSSPIHAHPR